MSSNEFPSEEYRLLESIKNYLHYTPTNTYPVGIGDDAAIRKCKKGEQLVFTGDTLVENVHFSFKYMSPQEVGYKAMVANISDCAAMGASPDSALIQIVLPDKKSYKNTFHQFYRGFYKACKKWNFPIVGGDLSRGPCCIISISLTGSKKAGERLMKRNNVQIGDDLWVTGIPGKSAAGLDILKKWDRDSIPTEYQRFVKSHIKPYAHIETGIKLSKDKNVHAVIDLSDGISKECYTLCYENSIGIVLNPKNNYIRTTYKELEKQFNKHWYDWFLYGGEDYELLFTASKKFNASQYKRLYKIGEITQDINCLKIKIDDSYRTVKKSAWDHFKKLN